MTIISELIFSISTLIENIRIIIDLHPLAFP